MNPVWNETLPALEVSDLKTQALRLECMDKDAVSDDPMGNFG